MNYSLITEKEFQKRIYNSPSKIKDILNSQASSSAVGYICQNHYFDDEKTLIISQLTALVLTGFISHTDLAKEISKNIHMNIGLADAVVSELDKKIFNPVKEELSKIYHPIIESQSAVSWGKPIDLGKKDDVVVLHKAPIKTEGVIDLKFQSEPKILDIESETIEITPKETTAKVVPKQEKPLDMTQGKETPFVFGKVEPSKSTISLKKPLDEEEAPMMLHKETELTPLAAEKKSLAEAFTFSAGKEPEIKSQSANLAAKISMGQDSVLSEEKAKEAEEKKKIHMEMPKVRVVHYSDLTSPSSAFGKKAGQVVSQSKEIKIGFEPKFVKLGDEKKDEKKKEPVDKNPNKPFYETHSKQEKFLTQSPKTEIKEEKKIEIPPVEQSSLKIDNVQKNDFFNPKPHLSVKEAAQKKAMEEIRKEPPKLDSKPAPKPANEIQLKDIPVEEDVIDLRQINE